MEHRETAAAAPVVRQLDFTANFNANASARGNLILPDHPQAQLQSKLFALAQSQQKLNNRASPLPPPQLVVQTKLPPPRKMVAPPKSPSPVAPRLAHPVKPKPALQPSPMTASPRSRERCNLEQNDGTPKRQKQCNCKSSRCLKLYCECFASGIYCDGCNCINCHNKIEHEEVRKAAVETILERKPDAFRPKIANSPIGAINGVEHNRGCNCKKSGCLKKYCECFQANVICSDKCKCMDCKNFEGSEERKSLFHEHSSISVTHMQRVTNAAINGAIGTACNKSRNEQSCAHMIYNEQLNSRQQFHKGAFLKSDPSYSPSAVHLSKPAATSLGPSTSSHRSHLAGILQLQNVQDFCTHLVELSAEVAKTFSENNGTDLNEAKVSVASSHEDGQSNQNQRDAEGLHQNQENKAGTSSCESVDSGVQNGRPLSPGTLALMCDERATMFMTEDPPSTITEREAGTTMNSASKHGLNQLYAEQEKLVLTKFHSFLNQLSHRLSIEGSKREEGSN